MQIFSRSLNKLPIAIAIGGGVLTGGLTLGIWYYASPKNTQVGYAPTQPVSYSHRLHAGQMGMDCRYCHSNIEKSAKAMIPPTQVCMGCHAIVKSDSARIAPLKKSWDTNMPVEWVQLHKLPDHTYFDHSAHLSAGVGCVTCHGRLDQMNLTMQSSTLLMEWCIACHRAPEKHLRPQEEVFNMQWDAAQAGQNPDTGKPYTQRELGLKLKEQHKVRDAVTLTNCSMCHR